MRAYGAILSARFRLLLQYRAAAAAGFGTQLFWGLMRVMIFTAFYASTDATLPMTLQETIVYIWLCQALFLLFPWNPDRETQELIRTGNVAYELVRPVDLYWLWFARSLAMRTAPVLLRALPMVGAAGLFFGLSAPVSWPAAVTFLVSLAAGFLISAAITTLTSILLFWTISGEGLARAMPSAVFLLSGLIVPLPLFPEWAQSLIHALPFRGIADVPIRLYMGHIPASDAGFLLLHQAAWAAGLIFFGRWLLGRAVRRVVIQGG